LPSNEHPQRLKARSENEINVILNGCPQTYEMREIRKKSSADRKTLRSIRSDLVVVRCQNCGHHDELDRKVIVKRYGALVPLQNLRRRIGMGCALMNADGVDRCQMTITAKFDTKEADNDR